MEPEPAAEVIRAVAPGVLRSSAKVAAVTGVTGLALGGVVGTIQSRTPLLFSLGTGVQCSILGGLFAVTRQSSAIWLARRDGVEIRDLSPNQHVKLSTASGAFVGASAGMLLRGRSNVIPGLICFSLFGYLGQTVTNKLSGDAALPRETSPSIGERIANSRFNPMKRLSDEEYRDMLNEKLLRTEAEIALIDENIAKLEAGSKPKS